MKNNIVFVCLGNICRSPMAEFIAKKIAKEKKINLKISSCATSNFNDGAKMHKKTELMLIKNNIKYDNFYSKQINQQIFDEADYIFVMDDQNYNDIIYRFANSEKVFKISDFSDGKYNKISDPWYTNNFDETYKSLTFCIQKMIERLFKQ